MRRLARLHPPTYGDLKFFFFFLFFSYTTPLVNSPACCLEEMLLEIDRLSIKLEVYIIKECRLKGRKKKNVEIGKAEEF